MSTSRHDFSVSPDVQALGVRGVYFRMDNVINSPTHPDVDTLVSEATAATQRTLTDELIDSDATLQGFRLLHDAVGRTGSKHVSAPETLLRGIVATGKFPRVNTLVDIYNLVSVKTRLALGAHDLARVTGDIALRITTGSERFMPLGSAKEKGMPAGEYAYVDGANDVICRMETRQVEKTKIGVDTTSCFYIVQGNMNTPEQFIWDAATNLIDMIKRCCGGEEHILWPIRQ